MLQCENINTNKKTMERNVANLRELKEDMMTAIENVVSCQFTVDNAIVFDAPIYLSSDADFRGDRVDSIVMGKNNRELIFLCGEDEICDLSDLTADTLAEVADVIEYGRYTIVDFS